ncbi:hypothetical protein RugamoR64_15530 [Duganella rhizosphaerae]|uniref:hypothetical protein n=1 Tax=Duganella rhizosphaerae TaxID=2885763 RepID=UPI0030E77464
MELTRDFETGIVDRIAADPAFANAMLDEVEEALKASGDGAARGMLRALIAGTIGFEALSRPLSTTGEALQTSLLTDDSTMPPPLSAILAALKRELGVAAS